MFVLYLVILLVLMCVYIVTLKYKQKYRENHNKSKLSFMYGMSMYIVDWLYKRGMLKKHAMQSENLKKLKVKDITREDEYMYAVDKVSVCIMIFTCVILIGTVFTLKNKTLETEYEKKLMRPDNGNSLKTYELNVEREDSSDDETIHIEVPKKQYRDKEVFEMFDNCYVDVVKTMLGNNDDTERIVSNLKFDSEYVPEGIALSWGCRDRNLIDYSGKIIAVCEQDTVIYLTMSYEGRSKNFEIPVHIIPYEDNSIQRKVQNIVNKSDAYKDEVILPEKIDGKEVSFSVPDEKTNIPFVIVGIVVVSIIYAAKDSDVKKEIKNRNSQMERDYPDIVSKLMMLNTAGLSVRMSWKRIVSDYEKHVKTNGKRYAYEEMKLAENKMDSGSSETAAYAEFGRRCGIRNYVKLGSILEQNIKKGSTGIKDSLEYEVREALEERKNMARKRGEEAGTKMLFPMLVMLIVSIVIIIIPSFMTMGM